ncbi:MAG: Na+/solute [Prolixibacteraceae bacterium]|nr:MAG: Na+/solute [Prolixibacteraceae bacterium]
MQVKIIIAVYFLVVLAVGVYSYFKVKTPADYYISGKRAGLVSVTGSMLATILGGSAILGTVELSGNLGWPAIWFLCCAAFGLLLLIPLIKNINKVGHFTMPELLGTFYGRKASLIASVIIPVAWIGIVAVQIIAAAKILAGLGFIGYNHSAILSGLVFIIFTLVGGQVGILRTDTLQSVILLTGLFIVFLFSFTNIGLKPVETFQFDALFNDSFKPFDLIILILTYSTTFIVGPDIYSRVFCAKNEKVASISILITAVLLVAIAFALTWLGFFSDTNENNGIISFAALKLPGWIYGLFIAALLSAIISSGTTLLNAAMILSELTTGNLAAKNALKYTQMYIIIIGAASMVIALYVTSIVQTLLFALTIYSGAFVIPTLAGLLNIKVNKKRVLTAIIAGGIMALSGKIIKDFYNDLWGSCIIILTYVTNIILLFTPFRKH